MKFNHLLKTLAITAALIGGGLVVNQTTAQAKGFTWLKTKDYSANPPLYTAKTAGQSVTMWNAKHTKKLHNLKNYPTTQWSVTQSVKMYNPKKTWGNKTGVYYKLTTQTGKYYGYVHRNFVKRVSGNSTANNSLNNLPTVNPKLIDNSLNQQLISLFPGTIPDAKLQKLAEQATNDKISGPISNQSSSFDDLINSTLDKGYIRLGAMKRSSSEINPSTNFKSYVRQTLGYVEVKNFKSNSNNSVLDTDYAGYHIGAYAYPQNNKEFGYYVILLTK